MSISRKELIANSARFFHSKPAVVYGDRTLSFEAVNQRANRLANALARLGVKSRDRVATLMRNCLEYPEIEFSLVKAGCPQVTLNPRLTPTEQLFQINETEACAVIVQHEYVGVIREIRQGLENVKYFICFDGQDADMLSYEDILACSSAAEPDGELNPDDVGEIRYTSGSTGTPKGVILPYHSRLAITRNFLMDQLGDLNGGDRFVALQPLYHGAGWFTLPVWIRGATHYIVPDYAPEIALPLIEKERITTIKTVPTVLIRLLDSPQIGKHDLSSVRTVIYGGSPMPVERLKDAIQVFGPVFSNLYGQLEAPMTITWLRKEENLGRRLGSVGMPSSFVQVRVVDDVAREVNPGEIGEVRVKGDHQMIGYLNRPEATAERIRDGWICTGDLGTVDEDGYVYLTGGRKSEMIISGGLNIYPAEVEQVLYQHTAVAEAGVIGVADPTWGEQVKACVVLKDSCQIAEQELIDFCRARIATYKAPKSVDFFDELPHTAAGKIQYGELRKLYQENGIRNS